MTVNSDAGRLTFATVAFKKEKRRKLQKPHLTSVWKIYYLKTEEHEEMQVSAAGTGHEDTCDGVEKVWHFDESKSLS